MPEKLDLRRLVDLAACEQRAGMRMRSTFRIGDLVRWNSEAGRVGGTIVRVRTSDFEVKGHTRHASAEAPQYEIRSNKTAPIAFHKGSALTKLRD